ncbi:hypothetical protein AMELA_G00206860, partial [Ameiurus melas]
RPHSRSHTALRIKGARAARGNDNQTRLRLFTHGGGRQVEQLYLRDSPERERKRGGESVCGLYTAWILNKERPQLVLELAPLHNEQHHRHGQLLTCVAA